jgi:Heavy metal binding domain
MKKFISGFAVICLLTVSLVSCSSSTDKKQDGTTTPTQEASLYQCPMQCEGDKTYDKPGKCPVCGMDLKQVEMAVPAVPDSMHTTGDSTAAV